VDCRAYINLQLTSRNDSVLGENVLFEAL